ncbi:hypothetical protein HAV22_21380 [Massilia sp. TW-1]|uniref:Zinc finger Ogr/Delta-type domain-containing protein n=1 Tax=Telluria antibiotica TaxID=2717319 RepID=A0ABX0PIF3_9BURK|nr:hypothetical protein [Telluria antibiotica]NIA56188.1 hypothetical protein [Telluria antibiotica]
MVAAAKINHGKMACPACGEPVALKESTATGTLSWDCQDADCEATGFAKKHTAAARKWLASVPKRTPAATQPAGAGEQPSAPPKPAPKPGFSFGGLK